MVAGAIGDLGVAALNHVDMVDSKLEPGVVFPAMVDTLVDITQDVDQSDVDLVLDLKPETALLNIVQV